MKLSMYEFHLGDQKAKEYLKKLCCDLGAPVKNDVFNKNSEFLMGSNKISIKDELSHIKKFGRAHFLQVALDSKDPFLRSALPISVLSSDLGLSPNVVTAYGSFNTNVINGCIESPELSLAEDIVVYRKEAVLRFNSGDLSGFLRAYRGALHSGISLIDCVLSRYYFHISENLKKMGNKYEYENIKKLGSRISIEEKIEAWMLTFSTAEKLVDLKSSKNWNYFRKVKQARNDFTHPKDPATSYEVKEVVRVLNFMPLGIGGMLSNLRIYAEQTENIGFIQYVKSAPKITIGK